MSVSGLKVEGVYRRCGLAAKVNQLVEALMTSPSSAPLESDEQGVLNAGSALKQYVRQQQGLIPNVQPWLQAAGQYTVSVVQVHVVHSSNQSIIVVTVVSQWFQINAPGLKLINGYYGNFLTTTELR